MNLVALKYLVSLAREKHFGHAAQACGVSQPTLSIAVKNLETELGVQLFDRTSRDVQPTAMGLAIVRHAMVIMQEMQAIEEMARHNHTPDKALFRLGTVHHLHPRWMPALMQRCRTQAPQTPVLWHQEVRSKLMEQLKEGAIDAAILDHPTDTAGLQTETLWQEPLFLAVAADHPLAQSKRLALQSLEHETLLLPGLGDHHLEPLVPSCPELARWLGSPSCMVQKVKGASLESIAHMVVAGLGVGILPRLSVAGEDDHGLRYLNLDGITLSRELVWVWRASHHREASRALLLRILHEVIRTECSCAGATEQE